jgi:ectoine hydroxylase-related dioxygenase (phytanoyl-CoA dioxygenase family)
MDPEMIDRFRRDGYLKYGRVIGDEQLNRLRRDLDDLIAEEESGRTARELPPEFAFGHERKRTGEPTGRAIHQFLNMWKVSPTYRTVVNNPQIVGAVRALIGAAQVRIWHDQVISKPPRDNALFQCHHDFYFWPLDRPAMVSCWLALDDATVDNGCMHVFPGSHRDPRMQPPDCDLADDLFLTPVPLGAGEPGSLYAEMKTKQPSEAVPVELKAGECMFHHCLNWHLTPRNVTDRQRRAFVMIFMPDGTRYNQAQAPNHPCTTYLDLTDSQPMAGAAFPICGT